ncbi:MAG: UDP-glucose--hexose-1-phosphate uridylyltransferase [Lachnospiraceae bacterium]
MVQDQMIRLVDYAVSTGLLEKEDTVWAANRLLEELQMAEFSEEQSQKLLKIPTMTQQQAEEMLEETLEVLTDAAIEKGLTQGNTVTARDLFDTKLMGILTKRPSEVIREFQKKYEKSPKEATDAFYKLSCDSDYIRRYRIKKDEIWQTDTPYGPLTITINLSKPEKDPRAIAAAKSASVTQYPLCQLCRTNEGYAGRLDHPARQNHRLIPVTLQKEQWYLQYSPYVYYPQHCIVLGEAHTPMEINRMTFAKLLEFVEKFPHYFIGSNADLPIVGGSILSHAHFQGGLDVFPMTQAPIEEEVLFPKYPQVKAGIVKWPMSVLRLSAKEPKDLVELADHILQIWRTYTDESVFIFAETDQQPHNTITPIARKRGENFELDLVFRNNITTKEHPLGVYHPHASLHHIKKENIGLIEVMGLAVLPSRLKNELKAIEQAVLEKKDLREDVLCEKHADWVDTFLLKYDKVNNETIHTILQKETGLVFLQVLEDAGVFKRDKKGRMAFWKFLKLCQ